ncbi:hypothetical protein [Treponema endosymbiont of Eucomonympha sp.]|uniref:hypothetical protein n=1 Tax=Treponema endosymbiont of Eucomonympha sp. TaxID=1580831 RepID=UPI00078086BF|nr:hypothetical protein [Treponema endosymbiont of Eucomonympha sp.]
MPAPIFKSLTKTSEGFPQADKHGSMRCGTPAKIGERLARGQTLMTNYREKRFRIRLLLAFFAPTLPCGVYACGVPQRTGTVCVVNKTPFALSEVRLTDGDGAALAHIGELRRNEEQTYKIKRESSVSLELKDRDGAERRFFLSGYVFPGAFGLEARIVWKQGGLRVRLKEYSFPVPNAAELLPIN